jgi:hypothetical protein
MALARFRMGMGVVAVHQSGGRDVAVDHNIVKPKLKKTKVKTRKQEMKMKRLTGGPNNINLHCDVVCLLACWESWLQLLREWVSGGGC